MGAIHPPRPVTPLAALLYTRDEAYARARAALIGLFGPVELESPVYPFVFTDYYRDEMGPELKRRFLTFEMLADPGQLASWKLASNRMEQEIAAAEGVAPRRPVNVDVGYLTAAKLVLATTKDFAHRLYLREDILAEITLSFRGGAWVAHRYTFPDYASGAYDAFLRQARDAHLRRLRAALGE